MTNALTEMVLPETVPAPVRRAFATADCVASADEVTFAVDQLAVRLTAAFADRDPLFITVLEGGSYLTGMLMARLVFPARWGNVRVSRYRDERAGGQLHWHGRHVPALDDRLVVFLDDIIDEGATLAALLDWARTEGAQEISSAVLARRTPLSQVCRADFHALDVAPGFLVGCGLDYQQYGRNLPGLYRLNDHD